MKKQTMFIWVITVLSVMPFSLIAQRQYQVKNDSRNPGRKIIEFPEIKRTTRTVTESKNLLDTEGYRKAAITYQPFQMVNPKTGKALDPNAKITLPTPDGKGRVTTVKQYFDELNALEQAMASRGKTLRKADAFQNLKPNFNKSSLSQAPLLPPNFKSIGLAEHESKKKSAISPNPNNSNQPLNLNGQNFNNISVIDWQPNIYISESTSNQGTVEFPVKWVKVSIPSKGRKVFPVLIELPKGFESTLNKVEWQISAQPFDETLINYKPAGIIKSGTVSPLSWGNTIRGLDILPNKGKIYTAFQVDFSSIGPEPVNQSKIYYLRVIAYDSYGKPFKQSNNVIAQYGAKDQVIELEYLIKNSVPGFNFAFPESKNSPFGIFIKGQGFESSKFVKNTKNSGIITRGFKTTANAALGLRYFNFMSIVNSAEPVNKELELLKGDFYAIAGLNTGLNGANEANAVGLKISLLGMAADEIKFEPEIPGSKVIPINYDIKQPLDLQLADIRFFIGPVPIRIAASLGGEAGIKLYGQADINNINVSGSINPYISSKFNASGGVDAIIAYATLNAEVDPLLKADMLLSFNSNSSKTVEFSNSLSGLKGRIYLKVGFYHPCPPIQQVKKFVGFISGDEDLPLCECVWEYDIFNFDGWNYNFKY
jgi:hypothetical protein